MTGGKREVFSMDNKKMGRFLKALRKEKGLTQEALAEELGVGSRTVSRWETGYTLPDLRTLVELAGYYGVTVEELLDGERHGSEERGEAVAKLADYSAALDQRFARRLNAFFVVGILAQLAIVILDVGDWEFPDQGPLAAGYGLIRGFLLGLALGDLILGWLHTGKYGARVRKWKRKMLGKEQ